jgi:predicted nucleic acid-binding protein
MSRIYLLDSGPLGLLAHSRPANRSAIEAWLTSVVVAGASIYISEVAEYEVRRELTRLVLSKQLPASRIDRLNQLGSLFQYLPVSTQMWRIAARFWAEARCQGSPTAHQAALDADVLIAAQAAEIQAAVVTTNPGHIARWVPVHPWP